MSCIRLNLIDFDQTKSGEVHGSIGDAVIAALSAEPETIHELEVALARFAKPTDDWPVIASLRPGEDFEPYDAGIVVVDLAARVVAIDSTYSAPEPIQESQEKGFVEGERTEPWHGFNGDEDERNSCDLKVPEQYLYQHKPTTYQISYHDGEQRTDLYLPYRLPDDWRFVGSIPEYEGICDERRAERSAVEALDARAVLYGRPLLEFLATEILAASNVDAEGLFAAIHARWLVTARPDLGGWSPREILLARMEFVDFDLHSRELQWSLTGECPPPLPKTSRAFRFGGFGTHEIVLYYDLIRALLDLCCDRARALKGFSLADEIKRLASLKDAWLEMPQEDSHGKSAAVMIDCERQRIPLALSAKEAIVDEDCPVCQAMAADLGSPFFWHLDGSNMDDRFEFSFFRTRREWEEDRLRQEAFHREMDRRWQEKEAMVDDFGAVMMAEEAEPC